MSSLAHLDNHRALAIVFFVDSCKSDAKGLYQKLIIPVLIYSTMPFPIIDTWTAVQRDIIDRFVMRKRGGSSAKHLDERSRKHLFAEINSKLNDRLYQNLTKDSMVSTLKYVYWETRAGVFVSVRNQKVEAFLPFANARYQNDWSQGLTFLGVKPDSKRPVKDYMDHKRKLLSHSRKMVMDPRKWWANHHFLNVDSRPDVWGQHSLQEYFDMISEALKHHHVGDVMFVINKRDHPILRKDLRKPYPFLYKGDPPLLAQPASSYAPIVTSYSHPDYLDITIPIVQDWIMATKPEEYYPIRTNVSWADKIEIAFFRGAATGRLVGNQRIKLSKLSHQWKHTSQQGLLDAGLTSWNLSDKVDAGGFVHYIVPAELEREGVVLQKKLPMDEQVRYKYLINMDGHTAPNRTSWILSSGCLMLMVASQYSDSTWIDRNLKPWMHFVPVKADLSDLEDQILWCRANDDECRAIVKRAHAFAKLYFSRETIAEYMAYLMNRIASNKA